MRARRRGLSLLELVVSMGLLSLLMVPVVGLLSTSLKVYTASNDRFDGDYARQTALDGSTYLIRDGVAVVAHSPTSLEIRFASGSVGQLRYDRGQLTWTIGSARQLLSSSLTDARFSVINSATDPTAGELIKLEFASQSSTEPTARWSTTQVWIRPLI